MGLGIPIQGARGRDINYSFPDNDSGTFVVGDASQKVIYITGKMEAGTTRTKFDLTIVSNDSIIDATFEMTPYQGIFDEFFTEFNIVDGDIIASYAVGSVGSNLIIKAISYAY